jgi:hypothetical protein
MTLVNLAGVASGWAGKMDQLGQQLSDPTIIQDPAKLAHFQMEMYNFSTAYQLTARTMQDIHREDQILGELLRDS